VQLSIYLSIRRYNEGVNTREFQELLQSKGRELYRPMPWREDTRPYYVLVSELMLQQTQVDRVIPKFNAFIARFPDERSLATAPLSDVLSLWNGLGYNRRAKYLHDAAKKITQDLSGIFPSTKEALLDLPGVGPGTAGAILAYAFNHPVVFIETNVRTVYFYHFFTNGDKVSDSQLVAYIEKTVDRENPREFYQALMDYGTWLKKSGAGQITQSRHYKKQPALKGSIREVRGQIIRSLASSSRTLTQLQIDVHADERFETALAGLVRDGLVKRTGNILHLTK
jgi:A/G-specific adenine glycosylase